jgi:hypothetical protein
MSSPSLPPQSERMKFPGMRPREAHLMRLWLREHESEYGHFDYNVRVGPGRDPGPDYSDAVRKTAILSSQLRLDAVAWREGRPTLIEVKDFALMEAVSQLTLYAAVWRLSNPTVPEGAMLLVCSNAGPGVVDSARAAGVAVQFTSSR